MLLLRKRLPGLDPSSLTPEHPFPEVCFAGGLACKPDSEGGETLDGGDIVLSASTVAYGVLTPSIYLYSEGRQIADSEKIDNHTIS